MLVRGKLSNGGTDLDQTWYTYTTFHGESFRQKNKKTNKKKPVPSGAGREETSIYINGYFCLFVCLSRINSQTAEKILTKLGTHILLFTGNIFGKKKKKSLQAREGKRHNLVSIYIKGELCLFVWCSSINSQTA